MNENGRNQSDRSGLHLPHMGHSSKNNHVFDEEFGFYTEAYFREMLSIERKRTERSQKAIVLLMLDIAEILRVFPRRRLVERVSRVLAGSAREIDLKGWYRFNHSIGIIYTETAKSGLDSIVQKVHSNLELALGSENAEKVLVTYALFPEEGSSLQQESGKLDDIRFYPSPYNRSPGKKASLLLKRIVDIVGSGILIVLFLPLFIILSVLIKITSRGPVLFCQTRIGRGGKPFKFLKFRSMYVGNDSSIHREFVKKLIREGQQQTHSSGSGVYKIVNDPRITPLGRFIRKTSLDELPQFLNVLKGDMALVGPRPPIPYELESYHMWHRRRVLEAKPGITGFWQVAGRSTTTFDTMVRMDLQYIMQWSLWWDIKLILRTPLAIFKGAY